MRRRTFLSAAAAGTAAAPSLLARQVPAGARIGIDLFSIRNSGWSAFEYLDYSARQGATVVHFSEIQFIGSLEEEHLKKVRAHAQKLGIEIELGMRSICPSSSTFNAKDGTAEEQLLRAVKAARIVGSPIVRAFLGSRNDRTGAIPLEGHIENAVKVLRNVRSQIVDAGLKVAIENHAGDMQGRELRTLIEAAGKEFVGACLDSGNPLWAMEDPHVTLEMLHPYVLTSHVRDTAVWRVPEGAAVQWVRGGQGNVDLDGWIRKFRQLCPGRALSLEVIVVPQPMIFRYFEPKVWEGFKNTPAWEFARFLALVEKGKPFPPVERVAKEMAAQRQREDLEASIAHLKSVLQA
jgi:3-oxoisoapionate decarboxylase